MKSLFVSLIFCLLFGGSAVVSFAKSVQLKQGYANIAGTHPYMSNSGEFYQFNWEINVNGNNFTFDSFVLPNFNSGFTGLFRGIYDTGQNITIPNFSFPFHQQEQAGVAEFQSFTYTKVQLNSQNVLNFRATSNQVVITATSSTAATASVPFNATGNLILKCASPEVAPDCNAPIRRVRVYGKGTMTYTFRRWIPSDGQWAWLNVKSVRFDFEE